MGLSVSRKTREGQVCGSRDGGTRIRVPLPEVRNPAHRKTEARRGLRGGVVPPDFDANARNPEGVSAEASTLSGFSIRAVSGRGPNSVRVAAETKSHCCVILANHWRRSRDLATWLISRSARNRPLGPPWQISRFAVVVARSTIPEGIPVRYFDRTFRLQFPADFWLTFLPASRLSGPTGPAVARRVGRRRWVSPSTWREK
jgi:hypothetical protein